MNEELDWLLRRILYLYGVEVTVENVESLKRHIENLFSDPWQK